MDYQHADSTKKDVTETPSSLDLAAAKKPNHCLPLASLHLLRDYESKLNRFSRKKEKDQSFNTASCTSSSQVLSTDGIMKMARSRLSQLSRNNSDVLPILLNSFDSCHSLQPDKYGDFELALFLQASALKFSDQEFHRARKLLSMCENFAPITGNPVQRVVHYFAAALKERINRETRMNLSEKPEVNPNRPTVVEEVLTLLHPAVVQCHQKLPICQVLHFTAIQVILEHVASAKRVHLIDFRIRSGSQWTIIMQALADRHEFPLELLKLTAVGTRRGEIQGIGIMLSSFAETLKLPFQFKLVESDLKNCTGDLFEVEASEALVVFSDLHLSSLLAWPNSLESLLSTIEDLRPCLFIVSEFEASTTSPDFMVCFNEALSLCSGVFDCFEDCLDRDNKCRAITEGVFVQKAIQKLITAEDGERVHRLERVEYWRTFLENFGLVEIPLSDLALHHADILIKSNQLWSSCTLDKDGKCLILGWKGTPIKSLSVWKFQFD